MKFFVCIGAVSLALNNWLVRALVLDDDKIKVYLEADAPKNLDKIRLEYEFRPPCDEDEAHHKNLTVVYKDCRDVPSFSGSGVYNISLNGKPKEVYCEINPDGTKYLVIQRRIDGSQDFYKTWKEYEEGFGDIRHEFWIGNRVLHQLTLQDKYKLRIDMEAVDSSKAYAEYSKFSVGSSETKYKLNVDGYSGNAGDSLTGHNGQMFSTHDQDNDENGSSCAITYKGAWWYKNCHVSNLNGKYLGGPHDSFADGVNWHAYKGYNESLKRVTMKIY